MHSGLGAHLPGVLVETRHAELEDSMSGVEGSQRRLRKWLGQEGPCSLHTCQAQALHWGGQTDHKMLGNWEQSLKCSYDISVDRIQCQHRLCFCCHHFSRNAIDMGKTFMIKLVKFKEILRASQVGCGKEPPCQCRRHKRCGFDPWVGKISWRRKWQSTPVSLPGKSHGERSLAGCILCVQREKHNWACMHMHSKCNGHYNNG